jgi:cytochrome c-type biogenesis protein CcmH
MMPFFRVLLLVLLGAGVAHGVVEPQEFSDEQMRERYLQFTRELRCPKCQNQNLADSNAPIAQDLRAQLYRLLNEGKSDGQIVEFMVDRYGDYVLYKPPLEARTVLLWLAPVLMLAIGVLVLAGVLRRSRRARAVQVPQTLTEAEQARLKALLADDGKDS